jgi:UDP-N-acetylmuramyl pentapeptide phosphotransferase/UDP-N-acetylglucosamine-1-phosphate transferase
MSLDFFLLSISVTGSAGVAVVIILTDRLHGRYTSDRDFDSVQKFHSTPVPRIGGIALLMGLVLGGVFHGLAEDQELNLAKWAGVAMIPVFLGGLLEDLGRGMTARERLLLAFFSASIAHYELNIALGRIDWTWFDLNVIPVPGVTLLLTVLMVGGVSHATNIIDGFNGLLLGVALMTVCALLWVATEIGEELLAIYFTIMLGGLIGVFIFNFPIGRIFLGDGGAYLIGFLLAILSLALVRNEAVSPWFPLLVFSYPVTETLFSMFRKKIFERTSPMSPDQYHYHMLVYRWISERFGFSQRYANPTTSIVMWVFCLPGMLSAVLWWNHTSALIWALVGVSILYVSSYFILRKSLGR